MISAKFSDSPLIPLTIMAISTFSSFFYGTLMHPKILKRVIGNDASHLQIAPAVLFVSLIGFDLCQYADYPGVVPYHEGQRLFTRELTHEERCVRGTLVTGLTSQDMACLDYFEGDVSDYYPMTADITVYPLYGRNTAGVTSRFILSGLSSLLQ
ncbi:hypothetical protein GGU10DRAFT_317492 [Lentinula aff. detonsa]|uniref:Putative gamma-glutamylcyclotransferase n=1 Tax=Lentinula aff. detonsa TaxID=2804958 RepID=A0AA38KQC5_9AGAR|nr:hypothetical protein GGU10DRAFT_317492 [Lentinula aff. detonsa]